MIDTEPLPIVGDFPDWSNDGNWIVVRAATDLWLIDATDFQNYQQLTFTPNEEERHPTFDATDTRIFFMINDNNDRLYSIDRSGLDFRQESGRKGIYGPQCRCN